MYLLHALTLDRPLVRREWLDELASFALPPSYCMPGYMKGYESGCVSVLVCTRL